MTDLGSFTFDGMTIEVESLRSRTLAYEVFWLVRAAPEPKGTIGIRRPTGMALATRVGIDPLALDAALADFLKQRSDNLP